MTPQQLNEILKNHKVSKARFDHLKEEIVDLERELWKNKNQMINDSISLSQAITGMPHGSGTGDPTGRLGVDIASGVESEFVKQIERELREAREEMKMLSRQIGIVENVLGALNDREREVLVFKIVDERSWEDAVRQMNGLHSNSYSKRTLQRLLDRALEKAYEVVR